MSENNKQVGIELRSGYDGRGVDAAVKDQQRLADETRKSEAQRTDAAEAYERKRAEIAERIRQRDERDAAARQSAIDKEAAASRRAADSITGGQESLAMAATAGRVALIGAAAAGAGAIAMTLQLGQSWAKAADEIGTLSQRMQISVEDLSLMRAEAVESDTSLEKLATGYKNLSVKMLDANSGNKEARALFKALGVEVTDNTGRLRESRQVMDDVASVFARMEDGAGKTAIAAKLLGKGVGEELLPYLNQGGEKLRDLREEAEKLGLKMDTETVKAVKDMKDNIALLKLSAEGAAGELAGPFFQSLVKITAALREGRKEGGWLWGLMRGGGAAAGEFFSDNTLSGLQQKASGFSSDIRRMEERLADPAVRGNQRQLLEQNLQAALQGQAALYRQMGEIEGSGIEDAPGKIAPPSALLKDGKAGKTAGAGKQPMTFEELLAKGAAKREQLYEERERAADAAAAREDAERLRNLEREDKALEQLARRYKDLLDPMEPLRREMAQLEELYKKGKLTQDEYGESLFNLQERMELLNKGVKPAADQFKDLKNALYGWGRETSRDLARMAVEGEISLKRLGQAAKNLVIDLIAARIQKEAIEPLINKGVDAAGDILGSVLEGVFGGGGGLPGGGGGVETAALMIAHGGGVVGEHNAGRFVHPAYYERPATRHHMGGIAGDEVRTVLQRGEEVITRQDPRHRYNGGGGAGNVKVEIINQGRPQEVVSATPAFDIEGMVVRVVTRDLNQGGPIRGGVENVMRGTS